MAPRWVLAHRWIVVLTVLLFIVSAPAASFASWTACGIDLASLSGSQFFPAIASDGAGGAIVAWMDARSSGEGDIYAQRLTASGEVAPGWPTNGVALCTAAGGQTLPQIISDGSGGAIAVWRDYRSGNADVFAQHVTAAGVTDWMNDGVPVCVASGDQQGHACSDGQGGVLVSWAAAGAFDTDIFAIRIAADGSLAPGWPIDGLAVCTAPNEQFSSRVTSDGIGGAIVVWIDQRGSDASDVYAQRISGDGVIIAGWPANGVLLSGPGQRLDALPVSDGASGAIVAWSDDRGTDTGKDIYAQHVTASGAIASGWPAGGVALCRAPSEQQLSTLVESAGGAIAAWTDSRTPGDADVYAQRIESAGTIAPGWPVDGLPISTAAGSQLNPRAVADGAGGAVFAWQSGPDGVFMKRITPQGTLAEGWSADGLALCESQDALPSPVLVSVCDGVVAAWHRMLGLPQSYDVFAQLVSMDGVVGEHGGGNDSQPPSLAVSLDPDVLFPPNHHLAAIHAAVVARDACDLHPSVELKSIVSNEPEDALGGGDTSDDIQGDAIGEADFEFQLRAERAATGSGRIYTVCYVATDASGNSVERCAEVRVPRSRDARAMLLEGVHQATVVILGEPGFDATTVDRTSIRLGTEAFRRFEPRSVETVDQDGDGLKDVVAAFPRAAERERLGAGEDDPPYAYFEAGGESFSARLSAALDVPWGDDGETTMAWLRPNPARGAAVLFYRLADAGRVRITVHDVAGRAVGRSIDEWRPAGLHRVALESGLPAEGIYLYRVETPARVVTGKFVFLK